MTVQSGKSTQNGPSRSDSAEKASTLDRRREKMQVSKGTADDGAAAVGALDKKLDTNAAQGRKHEAALAAALDGVAVLKKSIKASEKENGKLRKARKDARRVAAKARQRADTAEAKYDRAVLADMLRREKDSDLSAHTDTTTKAAATTKAAPKTTSGASGRSSRGGSAGQSGTSSSGTSSAAVSDRPAKPADSDETHRAAAVATKPGA